MPRQVRKGGDRILDRVQKGRWDRKCSAKDLVGKEVACDPFGGGHLHRGGSEDPGCPVYSCRIREMQIWSLDDSCDASGLMPIILATEKLADPKEYH